MGVGCTTCKKMGNWWFNVSCHRAMMSVTQVCGWGRRITVRGSADRVTRYESRNHVWTRLGPVSPVKQRSWVGCIIHCSVLLNSLESATCNCGCTVVGWWSTTVACVRCHRLVLCMKDMSSPGTWLPACEVLGNGLSELDPAWEGGPTTKVTLIPEKISSYTCWWKRKRPENMLHGLKSQNWLKRCLSIMYCMQILESTDSAVWKIPLR